ncbi:tetraspanin-5-like [Lytechinus variegatus]|uniref:tetraspanin-5-like n=1 Tax=Lytechinus variegatus TaxID=7654 RepID=UPI001BB241DC|nr:tetraspanin-5-like [Lytechinus variegatus]
MGKKTKTQPYPDTTSSQQQLHYHQPPPARVRRAPRGVSVSICVKYTIFTFNVIFWLCGVAILGFGVWGLVSKSVSSVEAIAEEVGIKLDPMYGFIIIGGCIFILAFLGCIGSLRENTCLLKLYVFILVLIFLAEVTIGLLVYFYQDRFSTLLDTWVEKTLLNYFDDPDSQFLMDNMQEGLECCGVDTPNDWQKNPYFNCSSIAHSRCSVPYSCCVPDPTTNVINYQCGYGVLQLPQSDWYQFIYTIGCAQALTDWFKTNAILLGCIGGALILMQSIAICLARSLIGDVEEVKSYW